MASIWYDIIPCCCEDSECKGNIVAAPDLESRTIMVRVRDRRGKVARIYLAPGWARVLATHIDQAADQVKPRLLNKAYNSGNRIRAKAA